MQPSPERAEAPPRPKIDINFIALLHDGDPEVGSVWPPNAKIMIENLQPDVLTVDGLDIVHDREPILHGNDSTLPFNPYESTLTDNRELVVLAADFPSVDAVIHAGDANIGELILDGLEHVDELFAMPTSDPRFYPLLTKRIQQSYFKDAPENIIWGIALGSAIGATYTKLLKKQRNLKSEDETLHESSNMMTRRNFLKMLGIVASSTTLAPVARFQAWLGVNELRIMLESNELHQLANDLQAALSPRNYDIEPANLRNALWVLHTQDFCKNKSESKLDQKAVILGGSVHIQGNRPDQGISETHNEMLARHSEVVRELISAVIFNIQKIEPQVDLSFLRSGILQLFATYNSFHFERNTSIDQNDKNQPLNGKTHRNKLIEAIIDQCITDASQVHTKG